MTAQPPVTVEAMRAAWERSAWRRDVPFGQALAHPLIGRCLRLGALILSKPHPPLDAKRRAAGETERNFT
jgi:hypothetical protein